MNLNLIFVFLCISIPAFSYAHEKEDIVEVVHKPLSEQELKAISIADESKRSSRNFTGYENIFGDIKFGDSVGKLGKDRKCNSVSASGDAHEDNGTLGCRVVKDYGTFEEIPVHDVEYFFQKRSDKNMMTSANIFLYKSEQYFREQYPDTATESSEKSGVILSAPKRNYATKLRCGRVASKLSDTWGRPETDSMDPVWIDKNHNIRASLIGVACNVLRMESL